MIRVEASGESCICDFTFDFYWQHQGSRLSPDSAVGNATYRGLVEALRRGEDVYISGFVGNRLASSLGVDLLRLGGRGGPIDDVGRIFVDGSVGARMGISMLRGAVYVSGEVKTPLGNVIEVSSDASGYRKFVSITELLERGGQALEPNFLEGKALTLKDGLIRDTLGARLACDGRVKVEGPAGMSPGILMSSGLVIVDGDCGKNAGVLMRGGRLVILGDADDFAGAEMRGGQIFIKGSAGSYCCAKMKGGSIFARGGKAVPPASVRQPDQAELSDIARALRLNSIYAMMYRKFSI